MLWKLRNFYAGLKEILYVYRHSFVFLVLVIASILLLQNNPNPSMIFLRKRVIYLAAMLGEKISSGPRWRDSDAVIKELQQRNIELASRNIVLEDAYMENVRLRQLVEFRSRFPLSVRPARIIARESRPAISNIVLDKGSADGIRLHQNVINEYGLVGQIAEVFEEHSVCQMLLDKNFRVASKIQRTRANGVVFWPGNPDEVAFYGVLKNLDVRIGDVILTSEYSEYFLPNFRVGVVTEVNNEIEGLFKDIRVQTAVDFDRLEEVFVVTDTSRTRSVAVGFENYFIVKR
ncbi:MAG TPA: rod shape-determining protein MreC [bacterium]|nr:rod shape-determining protein MreC [bacterium]HMY35773.1 rod shape-determining protein MreC [bacterium]HMZ03421.1 rod shape-determining protein MreC [bacterium]HNB56339.1 rod shape-determining protein MreC [bacterium]HNC49706.1 rod shape-determining protein MreC [bacterium]